MIGLMELNTASLDNNPIADTSQLPTQVNLEEVAGKMARAQTNTVALRVLRPSIIGPSTQSVDTESRQLEAAQMSSDPIIQEKAAATAAEKEAAKTLEIYERCIKQSSLTLQFLEDSKAEKNVPQHFVYCPSAAKKFYALDDTENLNEEQRKLVQSKVKKMEGIFSNALTEEEERVKALIICTYTISASGPFIIDPDSYDKLATLLKQYLAPRDSQQPPFSIEKYTHVNKLYEKVEVLGTHSTKSSWPTK